MTPVRIHDRLEDALYDVGHYSDGGHNVRTIARDTGLVERHLYAAIDPHNPKVFPAAWIVPVTKATKNYAILNFLAHSVGGVFVRALDRTTGSLSELTTAVSDLMREVADVIAVAGDALKDNRVDATEKATLLQQLREARAAIDRAETIVLSLPDDLPSRILAEARRRG